MPGIQRTHHKHTMSGRRLLNTKPQASLEAEEKKTDELFAKINGTSKESASTVIIPKNQEGATTPDKPQTGPVGETGNTLR